MVKKILIGLVLFVVLVVGGLIASTFIFKDEINELVKEQINNDAVRSFEELISHVAPLYDHDESFSIMTCITENLVASIF